jgi:small subunit ribosomal protein S13
MARIVGVDIPRNKKVNFSLRYIHGIGKNTSELLCLKAKVKPGLRVQELSEEQVVSLRNAISDMGYLVEGELRSSNAILKD